MPAVVARASRPTGAATPQPPEEHAEAIAMGAPAGPARPGYEDVCAEVERLRSGSRALCTVRELGRSSEGRPIQCVTLTELSVPADDKQRVLVVAGQHGTEESGRAIALELMSWLASGAGESPEVLRTHEVAVIPCANPDGAVHETYRNADDVDVAHTHALDEAASTPEGRAVGAFGVEFAPEVLVDVHGRAGGGMKDTVWLSRPLAFVPDGLYLTAMALEMCRAGEEAGFPQAEPAPPGALDQSASSGITLGEKLAAEVKSLGFGMETIEHYYREAEWRADGLARLRRLLRFGREDAFGLGEPGYPASLVSGTRVCALKAHGSTASRRRVSRVELVSFLRRNWAIVDRGSDGLDGCAKVKVLSRTVEGNNPGRFAVLVRLRKPCGGLSVEWDGEELGCSDEHGFRAWEDAISILVQANLLAPFGGPERVLTLRYDSPLLSG